MIKLDLETKILLAAFVGALAVPTASAFVLAWFSDGFIIAQVMTHSIGGAVQVGGLIVLASAPSAILITLGYSWFRDNSPRLAKSDAEIAELKTKLETTRKSLEREESRSYEILREKDAIQNSLEKTNKVLSQTLDCEKTKNGQLTKNNTDIQTKDEALTAYQSIVSNNKKLIDAQEIELAQLRNLKASWDKKRKFLEKYDVNQSA